MFFVFSGEWQDQKNHHFQTKNKSLFLRMKFLQNSINFKTKKRINKYKKWIEFIFHCFYVDIPSFSMKIINFLSFWMKFEWFSFPSIWQQFQVNFESFSDVFVNVLQILISHHFVLRPRSNKNFKMLYDQGFAHRDWI